MQQNKRSSMNIRENVFAPPSFLFIIQGVKYTVVEV